MTIDKNDDWWPITPSKERTQIEWRPTNGCVRARQDGCAWKQSGKDEGVTEAQYAELKGRELLRKSKK